MDGQPCIFALFGLGKLGGRELGYASDLEMLCVYSGQGQTSGPQQIAVSQYAELLVQQLLDLLDIGQLSSEVILLSREYEGEP